MNDWERKDPVSRTLVPRYINTAHRPLRVGWDIGLRKWVVRWKFGRDSQVELDLPYDHPIEELQAVALAIWRLR